MGDSAGGNLVAAVTIMAIERKYWVPDGLLLVYPALNLCKTKLTPSLLLGMDDPILPYPFLKMCIDSYVGSFKDDHYCNPATQYLLSPTCAPDDILK